MQIKRTSIALTIALSISTGAYAADSVGSVLVENSVSSGSSNIGAASTVVGGNNSNPGGDKSAIIGTNNTNLGTGLSIVGNGNRNATSENSAIVGADNQIQSVGSGLTLGFNNTFSHSALGVTNVLIGTNLVDNGYSGCVAFGSYSGCSNSNQFQVSGMTVSGVGLATDKSDAVSLGQLQTILASQPGGSTFDPSGLQGQIDTHTTQIGTLQGQVATNTSNIGVLQGEVASQGVAIGNLQTTVQDHEVRIEQNTQAINQLDGRVTSLEQRFNNLQRDYKNYSYSAAAMGLAASSLVFDRTKDRQVAVAASTVNGQTAFAFGVGISRGNVLLHAKVARSSRMTGASVGASWAF